MPKPHICAIPVGMRSMFAGKPPYTSLLFAFVLASRKLEIFLMLKKCFLLEFYLGLAFTCSA